MIEYLDRLNQLAKIAKKRALSDSEKQEQRVLRELYIQKFREQAQGVIQNVRVIDPEGVDITPTKTKGSRVKNH